MLHSSLWRKLFGNGKGGKGPTEKTPPPKEEKSVVNVLPFAGDDGKPLLVVSKQLQPRYPQERPPCPFYGFHLLGGTTNVGVAVVHDPNVCFADQKGNRCPWYRDGFTPCPLEMMGQTPDWKQCFHNTEENRQFIREQMGGWFVIPVEFEPEPFPEEGWKGIRFSDWIEYVMKGKPFP